MQIKDDEEEPAKYYSMVLFIDGFSHLREMDHEPDDDDDTSKMLKLLHADTDDEGNSGNEEKKEEEQPPEEEEPTEWSCPICTFLNPMTDKSCMICGEGQRPNVQELKEKMRAEMAAAKAAARAEAKEAKEAASAGVKQDTLH